MEAKEAICRVLDGDPIAEVKDGNGLVLLTYLRRGRAIYVIDQAGERPIMFLPVGEQKEGH
jgi:hypothetical protein